MHRDLFVEFIFVIAKIFFKSQPHYMASMTQCITAGNNFTPALVRNYRSYLVRSYEDKA